MSARNRTGRDAGQAVRDAIKGIMAAHPPLAWPLTAKAINARLPPHLRRCDSDICTHVRKIRDEAEAELLSQQQPD